MLKISFISTGTTSSQTPVMATVSYELVKSRIKEKLVEIPDFPLACVFDFSNMYSTLQYFATDKILMRMGELTSLTQEMKVSSHDLDWSKCSLPSKFVHKDTDEPLFFLMQVFERGVSSFLSKSEILDLARHIWEITQIIEKAGSEYIFFDLPLIQPRERNLYELAALLNSNLILGVIDVDKVNFDHMIQEIRVLERFLQDYSAYAVPPLVLSGLIFNKISDKVLSEKWIDQVMQNFPSYPIVGMIREDPEFIKIIAKYQIPTVDELFHKMRCAKEFQATAEMITQVAQDPQKVRLVSHNQHEYLEKRIFSL